MGEFARARLEGRPKLVTDFGLGDPAIANPLFSRSRALINQDSLYGSVARFYLTKSLMEEKLWRSYGEAMEKLWRRNPLRTLGP